MALYRGGTRYVKNFKAIAGDAFLSNSSVGFPVMSSVNATHLGAVNRPVTNPRMNIKATVNGAPTTFVIESFSSGGVNSILVFFEAGVTPPSTITYNIAGTDYLITVSTIETVASQITLEDGSIVALNFRRATANTQPPIGSLDAAFTITSTGGDISISENATTIQTSDTHFHAGTEYPLAIPVPTGPPDTADAFATWLQTQPGVLAYVDFTSAGFPSSGSTGLFGTTNRESRVPSEAGLVDDIFHGRWNHSSYPVRINWLRVQNVGSTIARWTLNRMFTGSTDEAGITVPDGSIIDFHGNPDGSSNPNNFSNQRLFHILEFGTQRHARLGTTAAEFDAVSSTGSWMRLDMPRNADIVHPTNISGATFVLGLETSRCFLVVAPIDWRPWT